LAKISWIIHYFVNITSLERSDFITSGYIEDALPCLSIKNIGEYQVLHEIFPLENNTL
jgi:hypothetical protein